MASKAREVCISFSQEGLAVAAMYLHHRWFFVIFLFCATLVLANVLHFVIFRLLRRKEVDGKVLGWGVQEHLGPPSRAIFLLTDPLLQTNRAAAPIRSRTQLRSIAICIASQSTRVPACPQCLDCLRLRRA
jgi:hypothetical protein